MSASPAPVREQALVFACEGDQLLGILSSPADDQGSSGIGVVIVVGGPQYRVGSHRQFALLARTLAAEGHHCLRFDYRGMGDSTGAAHGFLQVDADIDAAIAALRARCPEVRRLVLWGLCDAASAILLYLQGIGKQKQVDGLCLVNPWVRSAESLARTQVKHYYLQRLRQMDFWRKLLQGGVATKAATELLRNLRLSQGGKRNADSGQVNLPFQESMAQGCLHFPGPQLLMLSGDDYTAKEFLEYTQTSPVWQRALGSSKLQRVDLPEADHTFSSTPARANVFAATLEWLRAIG